jgi:hypothetical protein
MISDAVLLLATSSPELSFIRIHRHAVVGCSGPEKIRTGAAANGIRQAYLVLLSKCDTADVSAAPA